LQPHILKTIEKLAGEHKINPSFLAGLIAQESAFDHRAISWARAIGLTQITKLAEQEVSKFYSHWPRYDGLDSLSLPILKTMIITGQINAHNEWRLNPQMSIRGGLTYLTLLSNYWRRPENFARIVAQFKDPEEGFSQVILASYNSGFTRVGSALDRKGQNWIKENELKEARKYVSRILSYCYHFSHQGGDDADAT
jgi:soluble lytic murein transglycosylase-like protein